MQFGGAHKFLIYLKQIFPSTDIFTALCDHNKFPKTYQKQIKKWNVKTTFLDYQPLKEIFGSHYAVLSPIAFEQFDFSEYDIVISISAGAAKGIVTNSNTQHLSIILTPPRYIWKIDNPQNYTKNLKLRKLLKPIFTLTDLYMRIWDYQAGQRADNVVSISSHIQDTIRKVYNRESRIIPPPVVLPELLASELKDNNSEEYYVTVSRLYAYKNIDLTIKAFKKLQKHLYIIGSGPEMEHLDRLKGDSNFIHLLGWTPNDEMYQYVKNAKAFVFSGIEDFGIVMVESLLLGTPVIAYSKGGALDIVEEKNTGLFFNKLNPMALIDCVKKFEQDPLHIDEKTKKSLKEKYSLEKFQARLLQLIS
jgi:glycosyltransferase involved in cell wall biosynthesis